jgi:hypothetical protein
VCSFQLAVEMLALAMKFSKTTPTPQGASHQNTVRALKAAQDANTHQPDHHEGHTPTRKRRSPNNSVLISHATSQRFTEKTPPTGTNGRRGEVTTPERR